MIETSVQVRCDGCGERVGIFRRTDNEARKDAQGVGFLDLTIDGIQFDLCGRCTPEVAKRATETSAGDTIAPR